MTADQAFDNLANRGELVIPTAGNADDSGVPPDAGIPAHPSRAAMRVDNLLDDLDDLDDEEPGDYHPRRGAENGTGPEKGMYTRPTETELETVGYDTEEVCNARMRGARVVGQDSGATGESRDDGALADCRETNEADGDDSRLGLAGARRVPRFSYVPLGGMEEFEAGARDMMNKLAAADRARPSLAITSAARGEGRTELAIRLALALAKRVGAKVLLADFDIRKPGIAARLGISSKYFTVTDVLRGTCRLGDALVVGEEDNLYVLPARANDREGDEILDGRQVEAVFADMHESFDYTIIDCAPMIHADAMIVCRLAGNAALAGMCRASPTGRMNQAALRLRQAGVRVAGMLLTEG